MRLSEIAQFLKAELIGDANLEIISPAGIEEAVEGNITYLSENTGKNIKTNASAVITNKALEIKNAQLIVKNPKSAFADVLGLFYPTKHPFKGISKKANVSKKASLGKGVCIDAFVHISDDVIVDENTVIYAGCCIGRGVKIGKGCIIYNNVTIRDNCEIGDRVIIHPGVVIGADGFGFVLDAGIHKKIPQVGNVVIGDDVEIGANTTIDRATIGSTVIGSGSKIDNLVQIGHNVKIGKNVIIVAQVGIGGSSVIGDNVILAGQSGISDHTHIESNTVIGAQSGVTGKITKNVYLGTPGKPYREFLKSYNLFMKLPEVKHQLDSLEKKVSEMISKYSKEGL
ncbi:MAG: UDP-3-O-(3-hydroxymyristoyl)glucosamine N-acyltransferase [Thermodesulfovibrionales bacterium]|nr:UDP-3-O-(3-hydroxymyristoyl)glucosamine N-acyltransferase [Thermodesulfovibrionales bacterium]